MNTQSHGSGSDELDLFDTLTTHKQPVRAMQVSKPPFAVLKSRFRVDSADVLISNTYFTWFCAAYPEGVGELQRRAVCTNLADRDV